MGTAKDIIDLVAQLSDSIQDRKVAAELFKIISLTNQLQSENTNLQSELFNLQKENLELKNEIYGLKMKNQEIQQQLNDKNLKTIFHANLLWLSNDPDPYCPVCYESENKLIHMHNFDKQEMSGGSVYTRPALRCPNFQKCRYIADISQHP